MTKKLVNPVLGQAPGAGTHGGCGKTRVAWALMAAYRDRRLRVQPFKVGPDFINSGFHARITEPASRHLDGWMLGGAFNHVLLQRLSRPRDGVIVEGVAGLDDVAARRQSQGARHHERAGCERSG